ESGRNGVAAGTRCRRNGTGRSGMAAAPEPFAAATRARQAGPYATPTPRPRVAPIRPGQPGQFLCRQPASAPRGARGADMIRPMALRKLDEPTIDAADPWRNDDLQRRAAGETLVRLVQGSAGSPVISLKGSWGSGKSIFMKRVAASLELKQVPVCTIDAWRSEYL